MKKKDIITIERSEYESLIAVKAILNCIYYDTVKSQYPTREDIINAVESLEYLINHKPVAAQDDVEIVFDATEHFGGKKK